MPHESSRARESHGKSSGVFAWLRRGEGPLQVDFDLRIHPGGIVCPPLDATEALAGVRSTISGGPERTPPAVDAVCAAHIIASDPPVFAINSLYFGQADGCIDLGSRILAPAAWTGVAIVTNVILSNTEDTILIQAGCSAKAVYLEVGRLCRGYERVRVPGAVGLRNAVSVLHSRFLGMTDLLDFIPRDPGVSTVCGPSAGILLNGRVPLPSNNPAPMHWHEAEIVSGVDRPNVTWPKLLAFVFERSQRSLTLEELYKELVARFPWYGANRTEKQWKASIKHTLCTNREFVPNWSISSRNTRKPKWSCDVSGGRGRVARVADKRRPSPSSVSSRRSMHAKSYSPNSSESEPPPLRPLQTAAPDTLPFDQTRKRSSVCSFSVKLIWDLSTRLIHLLWVPFSTHWRRIWPYNTSKKRFADFLTRALPPGRARTARTSTARKLDHDTEVSALITGGQARSFWALDALQFPSIEYFFLADRTHDCCQVSAEYGPFEYHVHVLFGRPARAPLSRRAFRPVVELFRECAILIQFIGACVVAPPHTGTQENGVSCSDGPLTAPFSITAPYLRDWRMADLPHTVTSCIVRLAENRGSPPHRPGRVVIESYAQTSDDNSVVILLAAHDMPYNIHRRSRPDPVLLGFGAGDIWSPLGEMLVYLLQDRPMKMGDPHRGPRFSLQFWSGLLGWLESRISLICSITRTVLVSLLLDVAMDSVIIHRVRHFVLDNGGLVSFAIPHITQFTRHPPPSCPDLQMIRVIIPWARPAPKFFAVFVTRRQFTADTIIPPRTQSAALRSVRTTPIGSPNPAWTLQTDAKLIMETAAEILPPNVALLSTICELSHFAMVDIFTKGLVEHDMVVFLPLCPLPRVVVVGGFVAHPIAQSAAQIRRSGVVHQAPLFPGLSYVGRRRLLGGAYATSGVLERGWMAGLWGGTLRRNEPLDKVRPRSEQICLVQEVAMGAGDCASVLRSPRYIAYASISIAFDAEENKVVKEPKCQDHHDTHKPGEMSTMSMALNDEDTFDVLPGIFGHSDKGERARFVVQFRPGVSVIAVMMEGDVSRCCGRKKRYPSPMKTPAEAHDENSAETRRRASTRKEEVAMERRDTRSPSGTNNRADNRRGTVEPLRGKKREPRCRKKKKMTSEANENPHRGPAAPAGRTIQQIIDEGPSSLCERPKGSHGAEKRARGRRVQQIIDEGPSSLGEERKGSHGAEKKVIHPHRDGEYSRESTRHRRVSARQTETAWFRKETAVEANENPH
ncbi:hypothetical protein C8R46DRAFT_1024908 [Mycena filopes]|nr:hypothetical protein C8R46DRAFT_1024908 [Mycena filopes]